MREREHLALRRREQIRIPNGFEKFDHARVLLVLKMDSCVATQPVIAFVVCMSAAIIGREASHLERRCLIEGGQRADEEFLAEPIQVMREVCELVERIRREARILVGRAGDAEGSKIGLMADRERPCMIGDEPERVTKVELDTALVHNELAPGEVAATAAIRTTEMERKSVRDQNRLQRRNTIEKNGGRIHEISVAAVTWQLKSTGILPATRAPMPVRAVGKGSSRLTLEVSREGQRKIPKDSSTRINRHLRGWSEEELPCSCKSCDNDRDGDDTERGAGPGEKSNSDCAERREGEGEEYARE